MRVLLDTNILIHREAATVVRRDIGRLFFWLDKLKCDKCVHPASLEEIGKHQDARVRSTFEAKLQSYQGPENERSDFCGCSAGRRD